MGHRGKQVSRYRRHDAAFLPVLLDHVGLFEDALLRNRGHEKKRQPERENGRECADCAWVYPWPHGRLPGRMLTEGVSQAEGFAATCPQRTQVAVGEFFGMRLRFAAP